MLAIMRRLIVLLVGVLPFDSFASEWVYANVSVVEDYRAFNSELGILVTLSGITYTSGGTAQTTCVQRYRVVVGVEGVTADMQKAAIAMLLAARASGDSIRLYVNPAAAYSGGYCPVQVFGMGAT